jgi:hypothetical protein
MPPRVRFPLVRWSLVLFLLLLLLLLPASSSEQQQLLRQPPTMRDHPIAGAAAGPIYLDGADWAVSRRNHIDSHPAGLANYSAWLGLLPVDRSNSTASYSGDSAKCAGICDGDGPHCVGFTTAGGSCWLYGWVPALVAPAAPIPGLIYFSKRSLPLPPHPPAPPPPPPVPARINATVPGDIITDLQRAGALHDPYHNTNWSQPEFVAACNAGVWVYSKRFATPGEQQTDDDAPSSVLLVLDGIRNGAMVFFNGAFLGNATNAYRRYVFDLDMSSFRRPPEPLNELEIHFGAALKINCDGRYTHSQQIDWAPTMPTTDPLSPQRPPWGPRATFGFAVWKSLYMVPLLPRVPAIVHLVPHTFYAGGHPTSLLTDQGHAGFDVRTGVELYCAAAAQDPCMGTVTVRGSWPKSQPVVLGLVAIPAGQSRTVNLTVPHAQTVGVALWQPRGNGGQRRYNITATFSATPTPASRSVTGVSVSTSRQIGFRHVALVTVDDSDPAAAQANATHTGGFTMMVRVNGAAIYARGGAKVPMDLMEGRFTAAAHRRLVQSAAEGNFNLLR